MTEKNLQVHPAETDFSSPDPEVTEVVVAGRWFLNCLQLHSFEGYFTNDSEAYVGSIEKSPHNLSELDPCDLDRFLGDGGLRYTARLDVTLLEGDIIALHKLFEARDCFADNVTSRAVLALIEDVNGPASSFEVLYQAYLASSAKRIARYYDPKPVYASDPSTHSYSNLKISMPKRMAEEFPMEVRDFLKETYSSHGLFTPGLDAEFEHLNIFNPKDVVFIVDSEPFVADRLSLAYLLRGKYLSSVGLAEVAGGLLRAYRPEDLLGLPCWLSLDLYAVLTPPPGVDLKLFSIQLLQFVELHFNSEYAALNSSPTPSLLSLDGLRDMIEVFPLAIKSIEALNA